MRKVLLLGSILALLSAVPASWGDHKILWCHFPPGQWTGNRATSKALIINIDYNAAIQGHGGHPGDGSVNDLGPTCGGCPPGSGSGWSTGCE